MMFSIKNFFSECNQSVSCRLITLTEKILNAQLQFLCSVKLLSLHEICENTGFQRPLYGRIRVTENPYSCIFYAVCVLLVEGTCFVEKIAHEI